MLVSVNSDWALTHPGFNIGNEPAFPVPWWWSYVIITNFSMYGCRIWKSNLSNISGKGLTPGGITSWVVICSSDIPSLIAFIIWCSLGFSWVILFKTQGSKHKVQNTRFKTQGSKHKVKTSIHRYQCNDRDVKNCTTQITEDKFLNSSNVVLISRIINCKRMVLVRIWFPG